MNADLVTMNGSNALEAAGRLRTWSAAAQAGLAANTLRALDSDRRAFMAWAGEGAGFPVSTDTLVAYIESQAATLSTATVRRRVASIGALHRAAGLADPTRDELVRLALRGVARRRGTDQRQAAPITQRDAMLIEARAGSSTRDVRDVALVLVARDLLARSSELVALTVGDVTFDNDTAVVMVRRVKTSTEAAPGYLGPDAARALRRWLELAGIEGAGAFLFQSLNRAGRATGRQLDTRDVRRIAKEAAKTAGIADAEHVSAHSMRVGMAIDLVADGAALPEVMLAGGWQSPQMVSRYARRVMVKDGAVAKFHRRRA